VVKAGRPRPRCGRAAARRGDRLRRPAGIAPWSWHSASPPRSACPCCQRAARCGSPASPVRG